MQFKCSGAVSEHVFWASPIICRRKGVTKGQNWEAALDPSCVFSGDLTNKAMSFFFSRHTKEQKSVQWLSGYVTQRFRKGGLGV